MMTTSTLIFVSLLIIFVSREFSLTLYGFSILYELQFAHNFARFLVAQCQQNSGCICGPSSGNFCGSKKRIAQHYLHELNDNACDGNSLYNCQGQGQVATFIRSCTGGTCIDNDDLAVNDICSSNGCRNRRLDHQINHH